MNRRRRRRRKRTAPTLAPAKKFVYSCAACAGPGQRSGRKAQRPARSLRQKRRPRAAARNEARGQTSAIRARRRARRDAAFRPLGPCSAPTATPPPSLARAPAPPTNAELERRAPGGRALAKRAGEAPRGAPPPTFPARPHGPQRGQRNQSTQLKPTQLGQNAKPKTAASPSDARKTERRRNCGMPKSAGPMRPARIACAEA